MDAISGNQYIRFDVECGNQSDDCFQDDGDTAKQNCNPCKIKWQWDYRKNAQQQCNSGKHQAGDVFLTPPSSKNASSFSIHRFILKNLLLFIPVGVLVYYTIGGISLSTEKRKNLQENKFLQIGWMCLSHIGKAFYSFCEAFNGFVGVSVFDAISYTVLDVSF